MPGSACGRWPRGSRLAAAVTAARSGMSPQSLSEFTSSGGRVRLPSDQQLRAILLVCGTEPHAAPPGCGPTGPSSRSAAPAR